MGLKHPERDVVWDPNADSGVKSVTGTGNMSVAEANERNRLNAIDSMNAMQGLPPVQKPSWWYGSSAPAPAPLASSSGGGGGAGGGAGAGFSNVSQRNPDLDYAISGLKTQLGTDTTGHQIDIAGSKLRDLAEGQGRQMAAARTARGVSGTGVDDYDARRLAGQTQRALAGESTDIMLGNQAQKSGILGQIAGAGTSAAGIDQANRSLALQQWQAEQENARAADQARLATQMAVLNRLYAA